MSTTVDIQEERLCKKCSKKKDLELFANCKTCKYGKAHTCKDCMSTHQKKYIASNKKAKKNRDQRAASYRKNNRHTFNLTSRLSHYKRLGLDITKKEYLKLYQEQEGKCKICKKEPSGRKKVLCLDHCHDTLKVRGLLCDNCNAGLGKFKDNLKLLKQAINYLDNNG